MELPGGRAGGRQMVRWTDIEERGLIEEDEDGEMEEGDSVWWLLRGRKKPEEDLKAARSSGTRPGTI